ncbi:CHY zinc finger protein [Streptococcus oricebi]|uniref:CHY-type domain-containing protein n=1 Tax=Streptococcus oricebi TaxID=1547447 RepID=A0ABS5B2N2_9STRE|nr:CHY zinc finger protein [Streptococcus oricebi]MBP2622941.1 hypothetical protein [Streptococcus oricebi]
MMRVFGLEIDEETRCLHYHSDLDIVALKCWACQDYFSCYQCHDSLRDHHFVAYPSKQKSDKVVLCGACKSELTISLYRGQLSCPNCKRAFNPACKNHYDLYFRD